MNRDILNQNVQFRFTAAHESDLIPTIFAAGLVDLPHMPPISRDR
jgi:hypothetical protein